jgi:hypothetical protein
MEPTQEGYTVSAAVDSWRRQRPRSRRFGTSVTNAVWTLLPALVALAVTFVIIEVSEPPRINNFAEAFHLLGKSVEREALSFNTMVIGVLASLLVAQVVARRPRFKTEFQVRNYGSAALFAHLLAGLALAATVLSVFGAFGDIEAARGLWVIMASMVVAVGVAQWIEWYWARNRRLLRKRTRAEIAVNAWSIHRSTAFLYSIAGSRQHPTRKLMFYLLSVVIVAAMAGMAAMELIMLATARNSPGEPALLAYAVIVLPVSILGVSFAAVLAALQACQMLTRERRGSAFVRLFASVFLGLPTLIALLLIHWEGTAARAGTVGLLVSLTLPFILLILPSKNPHLSIHPRLVAVNLKRSRRKRIKLLRDLWAIEHQAGRRIRARRIRRASLNFNRPTTGLGSSDQ